MAGLRTVLLLLGLAVVSIEATTDYVIIPIPKFKPLAVAAVGAKILGAKIALPKAKLLGVAALPLLAKKAVVKKVVFAPAAALAASKLLHKYPVASPQQQVVVVKGVPGTADWPAAWPETSAWPAASEWPATAPWSSASLSSSAWPSTVGAGSGFSLGQSFASPLAATTGFAALPASAEFSVQQAPTGFGVHSAAAAPVSHALPAFAAFPKQPAPAVVAYPAFTADTGLVSGGQSVGHADFGASQAVASVGQSPSFPAYSPPKSSGAAYATSYPVFSQVKPVGSAHAANYPVYAQAKPVGTAFANHAYSVPTKSAGAEYVTAGRFPASLAARPVAGGFYRYSAVPVPVYQSHPVYAVGPTIKL